MYFTKLIAVSMAFVAFGAAAPSTEQGKEKRTVSTGVRNSRRKFEYCSALTQLLTFVLFRNATGRPAGLASLMCRAMLDL